MVASEKRCAPVRMATPVPYSVWKTFASSTWFCSTSCATERKGEREVSLGCGTQGLQHAAREAPGLWERNCPREE